VKHAINDEKFQGKITEEDKRNIMSKISDIESWMSSHQDVEASEYESKQK